MERIELSNAAFEGDNNAYLFADGTETTLVDTGDWLEGTHSQLEAALASRGVNLADIDRLFLTHWHGDHTGLAGKIQAESGATVYLHKADAPLIRGDESAWEEMRRTQIEYFDHWGIPEADQSELLEITKKTPYLENPPDVTPIEDGETFSVNGQGFKTVHAPGHTAGQCMFETTISGGRDVLSGDALLPKYTPNVGGADVRVERPLAKYLETLTGIADADYDRAWPGHREPIDDPAARAEEIFHHHEERSWRVLDALRRVGPCDTWTVSADLFGGLEGIHMLHGPGESYAHLEHLREEDLVVQNGREYRLADGVEERLEAREDGRWPLA